jgi:hypothetical protein
MCESLLGEIHFPIPGELGLTGPAASGGSYSLGLSTLVSFVQEAVAVSGTLFAFMHRDCFASQTSTSLRKSSEIVT